MPRGRKKNQTLYSIYIDDEFIDTGSVHELEHRQGINHRKIWRYATPSMQKRKKTNKGLRVYKEIS